VFARYCRLVAGELGDLMPFVGTINEPQMIALHGYLEGYHPPATTNAVLWKRAGRVLLDAHHAAVRAVHDASPASLTGLLVQLPLLAPARDDDACHAFLRSMRHEIVDLYLEGLTGPDRGDWLGVQYYRKQWVDPASPTGFADPPAGTPTTQMGWAVHPDGLREILHRAARTGLPLYVTENGIATGDDADRIRFTTDALRGLADAIAAGADVRGYVHWSLLDNFEWMLGFAPTFGLVAVDRETFARTPKPSLAWLGEVAKRNGLPD
jgi:beta-glucosidase